MPNPYALFALQILVDENGDEKQLRTFVRSYKGIVIDFEDASDGTKSTVIRTVRDWLEKVDP